MVAEEAAVRVLYVPAAHKIQVEAPIVEENVPAGQLKQMGAPLILYDPAEQGWQLVAEKAPIAAEKVPYAKGKL